MSRLSIHLLGPFQAYLEGQPLENFKSDKARALLAYLAVESQQTHSRMKLAALLWPEMPDAEALANLRFTLSSLRKTLRDRQAPQPVLRVGRETLQFNPLSDAWVDVAFFERQAAYGADLNPLQAMPYLTAAMQVFQGDFMEGFCLAGCLDFEDWLLLKREKLNTQAISLLYNLTEFYEDRQHWEHALAYNRQALDLAPWNERLHQKAMCLLVQMGNPAAALAQYQACKRLLASELKLAPSPATKTAARQIRDGRMPKRPLAAAPASPGSGERVCVGRSTELGYLQDGLQAALDGRGQTLFICGGAGSGKTTLLDYFLSQALAAHPDLLAAWGSCPAISDAFTLPFQPFRDMLASLTGEFAAQRATGLFSPAYARRVWNVLPEVCQILVERAPDLLGPLLPVDGLQKRLEAFTVPGSPWRQRLDAMIARRGERPLVSQEDLLSEIARLLQTLSDLYPLVLVFDDLQWADPASLSLLYYLGQRLKNHRALLLGAYRPTQRRKTQSLSLLGVVRETQRRTGLAPLNLDQCDGRAFITDLLETQDYRVSAGFQERLFQQTGGQALFTVETLRGMQGSQKLARDTQGYWVETPALDWQTIPDRVDAILAEDFAHFPAAARPLLKVASLLGNSPSAQVISRVAEIDEGAVNQTLSALPGGEMAWLQPQPPAIISGQISQIYRFRHRLYQKFILQQINTIEWSVLHGRIGRALIDLYPLDCGEVAAQIAYHFEQAREIEQALPFYLQAAQYASSLSAYEQSIAILTHARELLTTLPLSSARDARELQLLNALSGQLLGGAGWGSDKRRRVTQRAYKLCQLAGETTASQFLLTLFSLADLARARAEHAKSLQLGQQMMTLVRETADPEFLALTHWTLGATHFFRGELGEAREHLESVLTLHTPSKESAITAITGTDAAVVSLCWLSWAYALDGEWQAAQQAGTRSVTLATQIEHPFNQVFALIFGECGLRALGRDWPGVQNSLQAILPLVERADLAPMKPWALVFQGWAETFAGNAETGIPRIRAGMDAWRAAGAVSGLTCMGYFLAEACLRAGRFDEAQTAITETRALMAETGENLFAEKLRGVKETMRALPQHLETEYPEE